MILNRGLDEETGEPKYARVELERRWLVDPAARPALDGCHCTLIEDRYIEQTRMRLRRMSRPGWDKTKWKLTKKYDTERPEARPIVTTYLTEAEHALLAALPALPMTKRRSPADRRPLLEPRPVRRRACRARAGRDRSGRQGGAGGPCAAALGV